jgi:hypothetical protein
MFLSDSIMMWVWRMQPGALSHFSTTLLGGERRGGGHRAADERGLRAA